MIYLNSFSRSLGPGLRLGYMVVPPDLIHATSTLKGLIDNGSPWLEQAALTRFLAGGSYAAHLKRLLKLHRSRRDAVVEGVSQHFPGSALLGVEGGTHVLWKLPGGMNAVDLQREARSVGVGIHPINAGAVLHHEVLEESESRLVLGYTHLAEALIAEGFSRLRKAAGRI